MCVCVTAAMVLCPAPSLQQSTIYNPKKKVVLSAECWIGNFCLNSCLHTYSFHRSSLCINCIWIWNLSINIRQHKAQRKTWGGRMKRKGKKRKGKKRKEKKRKEKKKIKKPRTGKKTHTHRKNHRSKPKYYSRSGTHKTLKELVINKKWMENVWKNEMLLRSLCVVQIKEVRYTEI